MFDNNSTHSISRAPQAQLLGIELSYPVCVPEGSQAREVFRQQSLRCERMLQDEEEERIKAGRVTDGQTKAQAGGGLLRLGRREAVHPDLRAYMPGGHAYPDTSVAALQRLAASAPVVSAARRAAKQSAAVQPNDAPHFGTSQALTSNVVAGCSHPPAPRMLL